jgi:hypothetical protein
LEKREIMEIKKSYLGLGILTAIGLIGYGVSYLIVLPKVDPGNFIPASFENSTGHPGWFGPVLAVCILLYAITFLPVMVLFTVKKSRLNPYALIFAGCILGISLLLEIVNNLPVLATSIYHGQLASISSNTLLYLKQVETLRYLSYDVAGFTLAYIAIFIYAVVYFKTQKLLAYTVFTSIVVFLASVPCMKLAPNEAVICLAISVFTFAPVPIFLARQAIE